LKISNKSSSKIVQNYPFCILLIDTNCQSNRPTLSKLFGIRFVSKIDHHQPCWRIVSGAQQSNFKKEKPA
jgi:hypothetical protein